MGKDAMSIRFKEFYEKRTRGYLPRRTYSVIRIDGKAFHTYCRGLKKPFDMGFIEDMDSTAIYLCKNIQGAKMAFVQSDEISIILTDFDTLKTDAWFDGEVQKMVSVSASMAAAKFNQLRILRFVNDKFVDGTNKITELYIENLTKIKLAEFDSRVFTVPFKDEVINYIVWRQNDTVRNSIQSLAQSLYSDGELKGKNGSMLQEMCFQKGENWNNLPDSIKRGRLITKESIIKNGAIRNVWTSKSAPDVLKNRSLYNEILP